MKSDATPPRGDTATAAEVGDYKRLLQRVLDNRPSGSRLRLANALGKNRSFVSQICNPAYPTPIPAGHVDTILEVCHFTADERKAFRALYARAHPRSARAPRGAVKPTRTISLVVPDFGTSQRNRLFDRALADLIRGLSGMAGHWNDP